MKKYKIAYIFVFALCFVLSCKQEIIELQPPTQDSTIVEPGVKGQLDFTKFVAVGSSYTAGFQAGALFTAGQDNSLAAILNKQFESVGAPAEFKQPTIKTDLGFNIFVTPNPISIDPPVVAGRFLLQYNGADSPLPTPQIAHDLGSVPNPQVNPDFIYGDGSTKAALNNFSIQAIFLGQSLITQTGNWGVAGADPRFNPFYARLAYPGNGTATIIGDVAAAGGSFMFFWLGMDDFLLHAAYGGDATKAPLTNANGGAQTDFDFQYAAAVGTLLGSNSNLKGVVANFPDIFKMPHFTAVPYNPVPLDQATADLVNSNYAGYNAILDALKGPPFSYSAADVDARKIEFAAGYNAFVMVDESVNDYGDEFDILQGAGAITAQQRAALVPYEQVRQTTNMDIIPLAAGSKLGTLADPNNPLSIYGVAVPMADQYVLIPDEINAINTARSAYNVIVAGVAAANSSKLALADMASAYDNLVAHQIEPYNGVFVSPKIDPPTGIFSEDGLHPNTRGYAYLSNVVIGAINAKTEWGATIPKTDISKYGATALPIP